MRFLIALQSRLGSCALSSAATDRKSTRLNSSHSQISYAVFCLKKKKHDIHVLSTSSVTCMPAPTIHASSYDPMKLSQPSITPIHVDYIRDDHDAQSRPCRTFTV